MLRIPLVITAAALLALGGTACSPAGAPAPSSGGQPGASPSSAAPAAAVPPAPTITSGRKEATLVAGPRKRLEELLVALRRNDIPAARSALSAYNAEWNGIEVYINYRSRALYGELETHYEADITKALEEPQPKPAEIVPLVEQMIGKYDEAIRLSDTGPALHPLFDDVAAIRIVRAPLRDVTPALKAGDTARAKAQYTAFKDHWDDIEDLIKARSAGTYREIEQAMTQVDVAFASNKSAADTAAAVDALSERFNYGLSLVNAAARNADVSKTAYAEQDLQTAVALGAVEKDLRASLAAWEAGSYDAAGQAARHAAGERFATVAPALQARGGADAPLKKALDAYAGVTGGPGDAARVRAANKAAIEAVWLAQQTVAGQFWTDPTFKAAYEQSL